MKYTVLFLLLYFPFRTVAQDSPANDSATVVAGPWSLKDCISYAQENNINLNTLRLAKASAEQDVIQAKAAQLPDLSFNNNNSATHYQTKQLGASRDINFSGSAGLNTAVTLYNGGALQTDIKLRKVALSAADLNIAEADNTLYLEIIEAYTNILLDKETVLYAQDLVATSRAQTEQMRQQYRVGTMAKKDLIQLEAQLANDQFTLTNAENAEKQDKLTLKQLLQLPVLQTFDIEKPDTAVKLLAIPTLDQVLQEALAKRPEVKNSELTVESAQLDLKLAKSGYLPVLSLNCGLATSYGNFDTVGFATGQLYNNFYQQVGLTLTIPIFSRKINKSNVARSKIAIKQAELGLLNTKTLLSQQVEQAYLSTKNAYSQFKASNKQLSYNEEAYRIAGEELRVGSSNTVEYVQQKNLYIQALQSYTQAKYNALLSWNVFRFYQGDLFEPMHN